MDQVLITKQLRPEQKAFEPAVWESTKEEQTACFWSAVNSETNPSIEDHKTDHGSIQRNEQRVDLPRISHHLNPQHIMVERYRHSVYKQLPQASADKTIFMPGQVLDECGNTRNSTDKSLLTKEHPSFRASHQAKRFFKSSNNSIEHRQPLESSKKSSPTNTTAEILFRQPQHKWVEQHIRAQHSLPHTPLAKLPVPLPGSAERENREKQEKEQDKSGDLVVGSDLLSFYKKELVDNKSCLSQNLDKEKDKVTRMFYNILTAAKSKNHTLKKMSKAMKKTEEKKIPREHHQILLRQASSQTCINEEEVLGSKYE